MSAKETRQERSIPVQGRVNVVELADIAMYFESERVRLKTMSQLVGYCVDLAWNALMASKMIENKHETVADAHSSLTYLGLYQDSMLKKTLKKINTSVAFENLRKEGIDPREYVPQQYNILHNKKSVLVEEDEDKVDKALGISGKNIISRAKAREMLKKQEEFERKQLLERSKVEVRNELTPEERKRLFRDPNWKPEPIPEDEIVTPLKPATLTSRLPYTSPPDTDEPSDEVDEVDELLGNIPSDLKRDLNSDMPRQKTDEEISADFERIARKDKELFDKLNECPMPK